MRACLCQPAGRQRDPHEGLVGLQLSVQLHEMLLLPLYQPGELAVSQLDLEDSWQGLHTRTHTQTRKYGKNGVREEGAVKAPISQK